MIFRIQCNTDTVDINQKCLGLDAWVPGDSVNTLNTNRGLHIQIRHNRDKDTFDAACKLGKLLAAAPEMLGELKHLYKLLEPALNNGVHIAGLATVNKLAMIIAKAEGKQ